MKKLSLLFIGCMLFFATAQSQGDAFAVGNSVINVGIGFGNTIYGSYGMGIPSISASYELGIVEIPMGSELKGVIGVGGILGWDNMSDDYYWGWGNYGYDVNINALFFGARGNYHFIFVDKLDLYGGVILGFYSANYKYEWDGGSAYPGYSESENEFKFYPGIYAGARYYFTDNFAVYSELGMAISIFNVGASFKF